VFGSGEMIDAAGFNNTKGDWQGERAGMDAWLQAVAVVCASGRSKRLNERTGGKQSLSRIPREKQCERLSYL
jgi:hypothetical protein